MYKKDFLAYLSTAPSTHFVLFGACSVSVEYYSSLLAAHYGMQETFSVDFDDYDFERCKEYMSTSSLFASSKLLHIRASKLPPAKDLRALIALCDDDTRLIISIYEQSNLADISKYTSNFVRFFLPQSSAEAIGFLHQIATQQGIALDRSLIGTIYESLNNDLFLSFCEMNKYKHFIPSQNFIKAQCGSEFDIDFELFFDDFMSGKNTAKNLSSYLFFSQTNEIYALNVITNQFLKIFRLKLALDTGKTAQQCLGYSPPRDVLARLNKWAKSLKTNQYGEVFRLLIECEKQLKTTQKELKKELLFAYILKVFFVIQNR